VISDDKRHQIEQEVIEVEVKPGWKEGTRITYPEKGDKHPGHIPADIVFTLKEKKHPIFVRDGADIRFAI
jgi:DnaJ-class molecular chaperone